MPPTGMAEPTSDHLDAGVLASARRRAASAPEGRLPCPACAAALKEANLERHLLQVHPDLTVGEPGRVDGQTGTDRRIRRLLAGLAGLWAGALLLLIATEDEVPVAATSPFAISSLAGVVLLGLLVLLVRVGAFPATVRVRDGEVHLRHRLGTGTRRVPLPAAVETGVLYERTPESGAESDSVERDVGTYLRVGRGRRTVTVGCAHGTRLRKHWSGWSGGRRRRFWDVTLPAPEFVAFQYALAEAGALAVTRS